MRDDVGHDALAIIDGAIDALVSLGFEPDQAAGYAIHVANLRIRDPDVARSVAAFCLETHVLHMEAEAEDAE